MSAIRRKINKFKNENTPEYILVTLLFWAFFIVMILLSIFRFFGIGYYVDTYRPPPQNEYVQTFINIFLKTIDYVLIIKMLSTIKWRWATLISLVAVPCYVFFDNAIIELIVDVCIIFVIPLIIKPKLKTLLLSLLVFGIITAYQYIMQYAIYEIDFENKFNYYIAIASFIPYKLLIITMYLFVLTRRLKWKNMIQIPNKKT